MAEAPRTIFAYVAVGGEDFIDSRERFCDVGGLKSIG